MLEDYSILLKLGYGFFTSSKYRYVLCNINLGFGHQYEFFIFRYQNNNIEPIKFLFKTINPDEDRFYKLYLKLYSNIIDTKHYDENILLSYLLFVIYAHTIPDLESYYSPTTNSRIASLPYLKNKIYEYFKGLEEELK